MHFNLTLLNIVKEKLSIPYSPQILKHLPNHVTPQVQNVFYSSLVSKNC